ncbi:hypothetical protein LXL04_021604 [Taraxacum kok-saghyz]
MRGERENRSADDGWKTVERRRRRVSKVDELCRVVTTFFISNLPVGWDSRKLWLAFEGHGTLVDAFVPGKRDAAGNLFGFVRFMKVSEVQALLRKFNEMVLEGKRLKANVAKHERPKARSTLNGNRYGQVKTHVKKSHGLTQDGRFRDSHNVAGVSYKQVLYKNAGSTEKSEVQTYMAVKRNIVVKDCVSVRKPNWLDPCLVGEVKNIEMLSKCMSVIHAYGLGECSIRYMGGLVVLLQFNSKAIAECFLNNQKENWSAWFVWLKKWEEQFCVKERVIWLKIVGIPIGCWDPSFFSEIAGHFGKVVIPGGGVDETRDMSFGKVCVLRSSMEPVQPCMVSVTWKDMKFDVLVKEDGDWKPSLGCLDSSFDSDEEYVDFFDDGDEEDIGDDGLRGEEDQSDADLPTGNGGTSEYVPETEHALPSGNTDDNYCYLASLNVPISNGRKRSDEIPEEGEYIRDTPSLGGPTHAISSLNDSPAGSGPSGPKWSLGLRELVPYLI